jgi:predicted TPR repeat methyltransferase
MALSDQLQALPEQWWQMIMQQITPIRERIGGVIDKARNPFDAAYDAALSMMQARRFEDALMRLKLLLWRRPAFAKGWYYLAICHFELQQKYEGLNALNKSLMLDAKDEEALYVKATLEEGKYADNYAPHTTPIAFILQEFSRNAIDYELEEAEREPLSSDVIFEQLRDIFFQGFRPQKILDAGCGTGACGELIAPFCKTLIGIDLSNEMLNFAAGKAIMPYQKLEQGDFRDHLFRLPAPEYDVIVAGNVIPITGGLTAVMDAAARGLHNGGFFLFTTYALEGQDSYRFIPEIRRFAHSSRYLKNQAERAGLKAISLTPCKLYEKEDRPGYCVLLQK